MVLWFFTAVSWADQIILSNGDQLEGQFKGVTGEHVIWQSKNFGEMKIPKARVKNIHSQASFKLRGQSTPCAWQSLDNQIATFVCIKGELRRFPILSLEQVVLFEGHKDANHHYSGSLKVSGLKRRGNTESEYWEARSDVQMRHGDWRHSVVISLSGQTILIRDGITTFEDRDRRDHAKYSLDWFFSPRYYLSNLVSLEHDSNRNIQEEYKTSSGLGYQFWEKSETALSMVIGLEHTRTYLTLNPPADEPESYSSVRLGTDFRYKFKKGPNLYHTNSYSHAFDNSVTSGTEERWEFRSNTGLDMPIGFGISANFNFEWNYKNHAKDLDPNAFRKDTVYRVGINYSW